MTAAETKCLFVSQDLIYIRNLYYDFARKYIIYMDMGIQISMSYVCIVYLSEDIFIIVTYVVYNENAILKLR